MKLCLMYTQPGSSETQKKLWQDISKTPLARQKRMLNIYYFRQKILHRIGFFTWQKKIQGMKTKAVDTEEATLSFNRKSTIIQQSDIFGIMQEQNEARQACLRDVLAFIDKFLAKNVEKMKFKPPKKGIQQPEKTEECFITELTSKKQNLSLSRQMSLSDSNTPRSPRSPRPNMSMQDHIDRFRKLSAQQNKLKMQKNLLRAQNNALDPENANQHALIDFGMMMDPGSQLPHFTLVRQDITDCIKKLIIRTAQVKPSEIKKFEQKLMDKLSDSCLNNEEEIYMSLQGDLQN